MTNSALAAIHWALQNHVQPAAANATTLFLRARASAELHEIANLTCVQSFKPWADELHAAGFASNPDLPSGQRFDRILLLPGRQRAETRALLATAASLLAPDGQFVVAQLNTEGARSLQSDCETLFGAIQHASKHKSRVMWGTANQLNAALAAEWLAGDQPTRVIDDEFVSRPGLFAWDRIDPGSALLAKHLPKNLRGTGADLGCGFGVLAKRLLERNPLVQGLDCFEAERRALQLAELNLQPFASQKTLNFYWHDVSRGLERMDYDFVISNPPFHTGRMDEPGLGMSFLNAAARALKTGGRFILVANVHLPYEAVLAKQFQQVTEVAQGLGFKVLEARK
jgi:16S rRNA (guanine1207-N2)-methyltransferase